MGFECVRDLPGLPPEILLVPLHGHSRGHSAVAVDAGRGWLLHAGDAYFYHGELDPDAPSCPPGLRIFQRIAAVDDAARRKNQERLRELARERRGEVTIFSAHDPVELARAQEAAEAARGVSPAPANAGGDDAYGARGRSGRAHDVEAGRGVSPAPANAGGEGADGERGQSGQPHDAGAKAEVS
jgi:glyoxylase-like metal-dependent hydrolase (beta-lactamase superfamily II)